MSIWVSILLITVFAVSVNLGVVFQKQAADTLPQIALGKDFRRVIFAFLTSKRWMAGLIVSGMGWGFFVWALNFTPISLARAIQGSGFVVLAIFSIFFLHHRLTASEWAAVIVVTLGIVALGLSGSAQQETVSVIAPVRFFTAVGISLAVCLLVYGARRLWNLDLGLLVVTSIISGAFAGLGDVFTKAVVLELDNQAYPLAFGLMLPCLIFFYVTQIFLLSRAYQHGRAIVAIAVNDFCARLIAIFIGVFAMGEFLPADPIHRLLRLTGFITVLFGTILLARFSGEQMTAEIACVRSGRDRRGTAEPLANPPNRCGHPDD
jgi:multidrug transporter EmrE-like cation transporter